MGPAPTVNSTSRISPSQNVGTDHRVNEIPDDSRSNTLPCRHLLRRPSHNPSTTAMIVDDPISSTVGQSRAAISDETDWWYCHESPRLPVKVCPTKFRKRCHTGRSTPSCLRSAAICAGLVGCDRVSADTGSAGITLKIVKPMTSITRKLITAPVSLDARYGQNPERYHRGPAGDATALATSPASSAATGSATFTPSDVVRALRRYDIAKRGQLEREGDAHSRSAAVERRRSAKNPPAATTTTTAMPMPIHNPALDELLPPTGVACFQEMNSVCTG